IQITGISNEFAKYSGYNLFAILSSTLFASSALYGLTGFIYVVGVHHTCHQGFYIGAGWNSITCALLAKKNPLFLIPASIILSLIFTSANKVALYNNFGFDTSALIQGIMLLCIAASYSIKREI
ncbi:MAG: ABC transporter permease, partial [Treponema sp.]|nr:ABC transporter permease [Treponema sp.]